MPKGTCEFSWRKNAQPVDIAQQWQWISQKQAHAGRSQRRATGHRFWPTGASAPRFGGLECLPPEVDRDCRGAGRDFAAGRDLVRGGSRADRALARATKIVSHDKYSFYNPVHHAFFDQDGGRVIYFEGTYTTSFSGNPMPTPRYDYNQIMYRLELDDPRLKHAQD